MKLDGSTILTTGVNRGPDTVIARRLATGGARAVLTTCRESVLRPLATEVGF